MDFFDQAIEMAKKVDDDYFATKALGGIASAQVDAKNKKQAEKTFEIALKRAKKIDSYSHRINAELDIATYQINAGLKKQAKTTFQKIIKFAETEEDEDDRSEAQCYIVHDLAQARMFKHAIEVANRIKVPEEQAPAYVYIASNQTKAGKKKNAEKIFEKAIVPAKNIEDEKQGPNELRNIAYEQARAGLRKQANKTFELAFESAREIEDPYERCESQYSTLSLQADVGLKKGAKNVGELINDSSKIKNNYLRSTIEFCIRNLLAQIGDYDKALAKVPEIKDHELRSNEYRAIAIEQAKAGKKKQALETFKKAVNAAYDIGHREDKRMSFTLGGVTTSMAEVGLLKQALSFYVPPSDPDTMDNHFRHIALLEIAGYQAEARLKQDAKKTFWIGLRFIMKQKSDLDLTILELSELAHHQINAGLKQDAKETVKRLTKFLSTAKDYGGKGLRLYDLARLQIGLGLKEGEQTMNLLIGKLEKTKEPVGLSRDKTEIAKMQAMLGLVKEAESMFLDAFNSTKKVTDKKLRAEQQSIIALSMAEYSLKKPDEEKRIRSRTFLFM